MSKIKYSTTRNGLNSDLRSIDSIYRMIVVAGLRSKQLVKGGTPRISPDPTRRRNISIALEEARRGLIRYTILKPGETPTGVVTSSPVDQRESIV